MTNATISAVEARQNLRRAIRCHADFAANPSKYLPGDATNINFLRVGELNALAVSLGIPTDPFEVLTYLDQNGLHTNAVNDADGVEDNQSSDEPEDNSEDNSEAVQTADVAISPAPSIEDGGLGACDLSPDEIEERVIAITSKPLAERVAAIGDLVKLAHQPRIVREVIEKPVEVLKIIEGTAEDKIVDKVNAAVKCVGKEDANKVFGTKFAKLEGVSVDVYNDPFAPAKNPDWVWVDEDQLLTAVLAVQNGESIWAAGPAGAGKTEFVRNLAAHLGRRFIRINFDGDISRLELFGGLRVEGDSTVWHDGVLTAALRVPGALVLFDEITFARPTNLSALHAILENERSLTVPDTGERITSAPGLAFFAADNTNGRGDPTGLYTDTRELNNAFLDRFDSVLVFDRLDAAKERSIVAKRAGIPVKAASILVGFAGKARQSLDREDLRTPVGLRRLLSWGRKLSQGVSPSYAFQVSILNWVTKEDAEHLRQLYTAEVDETKLLNALDPKKYPAGHNLADTGAVDANDANASGLGVDWGSIDANATASF